MAVSLNVIFVLVEGGFGFVSNSVALIADAGHNLSDVLGLVCAWTAIFLGRRPPGAKFTYGLGRSSVLAALSNAVLLLLACGAIAWEAVEPPGLAAERGGSHGDVGGSRRNRTQRCMRLVAARRQSRRFESARRVHSHAGRCRRFRRSAGVGRNHLDDRLEPAGTRWSAS